MSSGIFKPYAAARWNSSSVILPKLFAAGRVRAKNVQDEPGRARSPPNNATNNWITSAEISVPTVTDLDETEPGLDAISFLEIAHYVAYMRSGPRILMHVLRSTDRNAKKGAVGVAATS